MNKIVIALMFGLCLTNVNAMKQLTLGTVKDFQVTAENIDDVENFVGTDFSGEIKVMLALKIHEYREQNPKDAPTKCGLSLENDDEDTNDVRNQVLIEKVPTLEYVKSLSIDNPNNIDYLQQITHDSQLDDQIRMAATEKLAGCKKQQKGGKNTPEGPALIRRKPLVTNNNDEVKSFDNDNANGNGNNQQGTGYFSLGGATKFVMDNKAALGAGLTPPLTLAALALIAGEVAQKHRNNPHLTKSAVEKWLIQLDARIQKNMVSTTVAVVLASALLAFAADYATYGEKSVFVTTYKKLFSKNQLTI